MATRQKTELSSIPTGPTIPASLTENARYAVEAQKLRELQKRKEEIDREIDEASSCLASEEGVEDAATALLDGGAGVLAAMVSAEQRTLLETIGKLSKQERIVTAAIGMQLERMERLQIELSREVCGQLRPHYAAIVQQLADALLRASTLVAQEQEFRSILEDGEFRFVELERMDGLIFGLNTADGQSHLNRWLRRAHDNYGTKIPERPSDVAGTPAIAARDSEGLRGRLARILVFASSRSAPETR